MDVSRIDDKDYIEYLGPGVLQNKYFSWKARMIANCDAIVEDIRNTSLEEATRKWNLTIRDISLLVRFHYVDQEFAEATGMAAIERTNPA